MPTRSLLPGSAVAVFGALVIWGCAGASPPQLSPHGTIADITYTGGAAAQDVELLAWQNDTLFVLGKTMVAIPADSVQSVRLKIKQDRSWMLSVLLANFLPAAAFAASSDHTANVIGVILGGLGVVTSAAWEFSTPESEFRFPLGEADRRDLLLHLRFPYGVERRGLEQIRALAGGVVP